MVCRSLLLGEESDEMSETSEQSSEEDDDYIEGAGRAPLPAPLAGGPDAMLCIRTLPPAGQSSNLRVAGSLFRRVSPFVSSLLNRLQAPTTLCLQCPKKGASLST